MRHAGLTARSALVRAAGFLVLWLILVGLSPVEAVVGVLTAVLATWTSLLLLPAGETRLRPMTLMWLGLRFLYQSVVAGVDVARRALDPRMPLRTGFVSYPARFPPGIARNVFATVTSLLPGTVPAGEDGGRLLYHCLDTGQPVVSQLAAEEAVLSRALRDD